MNESNPSICSGGRGEPDGQENPQLSSHSLERTSSPPRDANEDLYTWMAKQQEFTEAKKEKVAPPPLAQDRVLVCNCKEQKFSMSIPCVSLPSLDFYHSKSNFQLQFLHALPLSLCTVLQHKFNCNSSFHSLANFHFYFQVFIYFYLFYYFFRILISLIVRCSSNPSQCRSFIRFICVNKLKISKVFVNTSFPCSLS